MTNNFIVGAVAVLAISSGLWSVISAQPLQGYSDENSEHQINPEQKNVEEHVDQFISLLSAIELDIDLDSQNAKELNTAFDDAARAIASLEKNNDLESTEKYRTDIQEAIEQHMERPGAYEAEISLNVEAYSKFLTETLIAQAGENM